jgi:hypothetical protein
VTHVLAAKILQIVSQFVSFLEEKEIAVITRIRLSQGIGAHYKNKSKTNRYSSITNIIVF